MPVLKRQANKKKRRNRRKQANRGQFKVRLIEKPLFPSNTATSPKPKTMTTTMTVTQSTRTNSIMTSVMWPTTKTTKVPLTIYNVPSARNQETTQFPNAPTKAKAPRKRKDPNPSPQNFSDGTTARNPDSQNHSHCHTYHPASGVCSIKRSNSMAQYCSGISKPIYHQILAITP